MIDSFRGEYFFLSNFYECPIIYDGRTFQSTEAAFQSAKTLNPKLRDEFTKLNPSESKRVGNSVKLREDWEEVKLQVMEDVLRIKFKPGSELAQRLLATGDEELVEGNTWRDRVWGVYNGKGENHLGKLLMKIRGEL